MTQPGKPIDDRGQRQWRAIAVLDIGGVNHGMDEIAAGVGKDMALPAFDLLARIVPPKTAGFGGFHALAVDHPGAWAVFRRRRVRACRGPWRRVPCFPLLLNGQEMVVQRRAGAANGAPVALGVVGVMRVRDCSQALSRRLLILG